MHYLDMQEAETLAACVANTKNLGAANDALALCFKWLPENDNGTLLMSPTVRSLLETLPRMRKTLR